MRDSWFDPVVIFGGGSSVLVSSIGLWPPAVPRWNGSLLAGLRAGRSELVLSTELRYRRFHAFSRASSNVLVLGLGPRNFCLHFLFSTGPTELVLGITPQLLGLVQLSVAQAASSPGCVSAVPRVGMIGVT